MLTRTSFRSRPDMCRTERRSDLVICLCSTGNIGNLALVSVIGVCGTYYPVSGRPICIPGPVVSSHAFSTFAVFRPSILTLFVPHFPRFCIFRSRIFSARFYAEVVKFTKSSKVIEVGTNRKPVCDFLLVINSNNHPISYRF